MQSKEMGAGGLGLQQPGCCLAGIDQIGGAKKSERTLPARVVPGIIEKQFGNVTDDLKDQKLQLMVGEISQIADNMGADLQNEEMQPLVAEIGWNHNEKLS